VETPLAAKLMAEYHDLAEAIDKATERKKEVLADLIVLAGARNATICGHKLTQVEREGAVSYAKALKKYAPDADLEPFRGKPTSYWRLS
jgi:catalase (peroxidase I)